MDISFNQITKNQQARLVPRSTQKAIITAVYPTIRQVDLYFVNNPQTILKGIAVSGQINMAFVSTGQKCVVDVFDENNTKDMFVAYTYGGTGGSVSLEIKTLDGMTDVFGVNKIAVTNGHLIDNGGGYVTLTFSGGGGGSPGGNNKDVQINDSGSFYGNDKFTFDKASNTLQLDDGSDAQFTGGSKITGGGSRLNILTDDASGYAYAGNIRIQSGNSSGPYARPGGIYIYGGVNTTYAGSSSYGSGPRLQMNNNQTQFYGYTPFIYQSPRNGGDMRIKAGNSGNTVLIGFDIVRTGYGDGGGLYLSGGDTGNYSGTRGGNVTVNAGSGYSFGNIFLATKNNSYARILEFGGLYSSPKPINLGLGGKNFGGGYGVISMQNAVVNPTTGESGAGLLYTSGGALYFRGSSGTSTMIAPA